jgi:eukaryotic-like serine/threonine-protein kinase
VPESAPTSHPPAGQPFGRFLLLECIGRGGMAEVFRALAHGVEGFRRIFVVKRIHRDKSDNPQLVEMFINEARISALLNHPNIVQIYDFGQHDGWYFIAMEHLRGKDLLLVLRQLRAARRIMPAPLAAFIAREVAAGLDYAHKLNAPGGQHLQIVHRDVSPSNVMLLRAGGVKLLDFGIAKAEALLARKTDTRTETVMVKGKLSYLSPEQVRNEPIDARSDIFSLGVMFWECLTGKRLFYDKAEYKTMHNVLERPVPPPSALRPDLPPELDEVVLRALERSRDQRYQNAQAMADDLDHALAESRFQPRMLPQFLDELFGPDPTLSDSMPGLTSPFVTDPEKPVITISQRALPTLPGLASFPPPGSKNDGLVPASSLGHGERPRLAARARAFGISFAGALVIGAFSAGLVLSDPPSPPDLVLPLSGGARARPAPETPAQPAPATVSVRVDSDPAGAEVTDGEGRRLGVTPLHTRIARSATAVTFVLSRKGHRTARHTFIPDGDVAAMVSLQPAPSNDRAPRARRGVSQKAAPAPAPSPSQNNPPADEAPPPPQEAPPPADPPAAESSPP